MGSLISQSQKNALDSIISESMFDTFSTTIVVWKQHQVTVISSPEDYNFIIGEFRRENIENVPVSSEFQAIIKYLKPQEIIAYLQGQGRLDERFNETRSIIRIKCKEDCYNAIRGSEQVEIDSKRFKISSAGRQHGLFGRSMFTILLEEIN